MSGNGKRNLVLGLAEDIGWADLRPFVESLGRSSFDGELRLFVAGVDDHALHHLHAAGVHVHAFRRVRLKHGTRVFHAHDPPLQRFRSERIARVYPSVTRVLALPARGRVAARARIAEPISIPCVSRYFRYYRFLTKNANLYGKVMVTDVRDVYFQRDPFDFEVGDALHCFLEHGGATLGSQRHNREWLQLAYGEDVLRALEGDRISCSGTTIGSCQAMLRYLRAMVEELVELPQFGGIDQAVHNYLIYTGRLPDARLHENSEAAVVTLAIVPKEEVLDALPDGFEHVNVFHQYDRHPPLARLLLERLQ